MKFMYPYINILKKENDFGRASAPAWSERARERERRKEIGWRCHYEVCVRAYVLAWSVSDMHSIEHEIQYKNHLTL